MIAVRAQSGNIDPDGNIVGALLERLRQAIGRDFAADVTPESQLDLVLQLLATSQVPR